MRSRPARALAARGAPLERGGGSEITGGGVKFRDHPAQAGRFWCAFALRSHGQQYTAAVAYAPVLY